MAQRKRSHEYMINKKYLGDEPHFTGPLSQSDYISALNWYNYMETTDDARRYIEEYLRANNRRRDIETLRQVSDKWLPVTIGWVCRLHLRGYQLPVSAAQYINTRLEETLRRARPAQTTVIEFPVKSIRDRMANKATDIIGQIEEMIDTNEQFSLYQWLQAEKVSPSYCPAIIDKYSVILDEFVEAYSGNDPQLKEGYSYLTRKELKEKIVRYNQFIEDCELHQSNNKKVRKPRKKRAIPIEKKLKSFKYLKEDKDLKIASVNPEKIVGASQVWLYNKTNKVLTCLNAASRLDIKGTTITGVDDQTSRSKRIGRKTDQVIKTVRDGGKVQLRKLMDTISSANTKVQTRVGDQTIVLRVV